MKNKGTTDKIINNLKKVRHRIAVLSGKGGVGKSTVCAQLAIALHNKGYKVGILDIDLCGPSIPKILGMNKLEVYHSDKGYVPIIVKKGLVCMSIAFLLDKEDDAVIWRGPRKQVMIKQFLEEVFWGELDFLLIDTPPGTSDEHIAIFQLLKHCFSIIVTQPQKISLNDVKKEISFCNKLKLPILGVIENMSGFKCPCCNEVYNIFSKGGGKKLAEKLKLNFLGEIPIDQKLASAEDKGDVDYLKKNKGNAVSKQFNSIVSFIEKIFKIKK